ncbi:ferredoxin family protein [Veillonella denticariosi JCM 15641]|uniref:Ferredoxin-like protein FixX n=2 Tax=Veillonella TaxID=29465 RepID=A0A239Y6Y6_9FIRM|nr:MULTISPECIES: ferredoxin family protein [Veillonella]PQL20881.1 ferredoxin family protein [Veillonella denticariosi JCM 15641]SNV54627.1 ferredoxin-like protein FixX [Veillonella rodentium]
MRLEERLGANKYYVDETCPHIQVDGSGFSKEEKMKLVNGCPAGLYTLQENGDLVFDFAGCLECGTCRVLCGDTIVKAWKYPRNSKGIEFRQG